MIKFIRDPELPFTLEQLNVLKSSDIKINGNIVKIYVTPTVPYWGYVSRILLCIKLKL